MVGDNPDPTVIILI